MHLRDEDLRDFSARQTSGINGMHHVKDSNVEQFVLASSADLKVRIARQRGWRNPALEIACSAEKIAKTISCFIEPTILCVNFA